MRRFCLYFTLLSLFASARPPSTPEAFSLTYSMFSLLLILFACVELGDAASAVHVYRLIQYDLAGVPLGSRISGLNHHAVSFPLDPDADLSRSALVVPLLDLDLSFLRDYISNKKPLGGLVILLPQKLSSKFGEFGKNVDLSRVKSVLHELEDLLVHSELPERCLVHAIGSSTDYRKIGSAEQGFYFIGHKYNDYLKQKFLQLVGNDTPQPQIVEVVMGRKLKVPLGSNASVHFSPLKTSVIGLWVQPITLDYFEIFIHLY